MEACHDVPQMMQNLVLQEGDVVKVRKAHSWRQDCINVQHEL